MSPAAQNIYVVAVGSMVAPKQVFSCLNSGICECGLIWEKTEDLQMRFWIFEVGPKSSDGKADGTWHTQERRAEKRDHMKSRQRLRRGKQAGGHLEEVLPRLEEARKTLPESQCGCTALLTPRFWTSRPQDCDVINFCCFKAPGLW